MLGTIIGEKYRLERSIGTGGMGEVFEARHLVTHRAVAVKLLYPQNPANEAAASDRFRHEAHAAGSLDAEHIVQVFDAGIDRDTSRRYLVMQLLHGESLHALIKRIGPLPPSLAFCIAGQAALGLSKAHAAGVIHRDIKPANIFLSLEGDEVVVKVLDFGIAKVKDLDEISPDDSAPAEAVVGSPHYMSPEQAQGLPTLDHRSDLYSLGAVLYRLLSGQTPHPGADTLVRLMYAICTEPARSLTEIAPWVSPEMTALVHRAISIAPALRFQSAGEMAHAVAGIVGDLRIAPTDIMPLSAEERAGLEPPSIRRYQDGSPFARGWEQTLQGAETMHGRDLAQPAPVSRNTKGTLTTAVLGAIAMALALVAIMGLWRSRTAARTPEVHAVVSAAPEPRAIVPAAAPSSSTKRTVWVRIQPASADEVLVDGESVSLSATGYVEVTGDLGSKHDIAVRVGSRSKSNHVVITADGAFPDTAAFSESDIVENAAPARGTGHSKSKRATKQEIAPAARAPEAPPRIVPPPTPAAAPEEPVYDPFNGFSLPGSTRTE